MKFKKLEVSGFKSFADRLEIKFGDGVTGIVGPNGCGKSNVADSIRWVLGEQSAKLLRGSSMQDVIFNGTENRKSLSYCEVSLYFDNKEKLFPSLDYDEVVLTRKLYRSGESEYQINKTQCRLKDITELLRDGGMGREGYSIIGQGRIDELLSAKPEDRRAIFEEAAGISKYKARKTDAERKLVRTRENLVRIHDILEEKSRMLEPLTRQSENARKWLDLRDKLKNYEINTYIYQYDTASEAKQAIGNRLKGITEEISIKQTSCDKAGQKYNEAMENINSADKTIKILNEDLLKLTVGVEKQVGEVKLRTERLGYLTTQSERLTGEDEKLKADAESLKEYIAEGEKTAEEMKAELAEVKKDYEAISEEYLDVVGTITRGEGEVESNHRAVLEAMDKLTDIKSNMSRLLAEREALNHKSEDLQNRLGVYSQNILSSEKSAASRRNRIDELTAIKKNYTEKLGDLYESNSADTSSISEISVKLDGLSAKYYMSSSRYKTLSEMKQMYDGFNYSVRNLLNDAKKFTEVKSKIEGVVAEIISVPTKFETAIEMALGNAMQNIVTKSEDEAKALIAYLKERKYGRVTFLPMTAIKPRIIESRFSQLVKGGKCYGSAADLVKFDSKFDSVIRGLLGSTVVAEDMDAAICLARATGFSFKIVTLDGDIINPHGAITGGGKGSDSANIFGHERELKELTGSVTAMKTEIDALTAEKERKIKSNEAVKAEIKRLGDESHGNEIELTRQVETYNKLCDELQRDKTADGILNEELTKAISRIEEINTDVNSVGELELLITSKKQEASQTGEETQAQFDDLKKKREALSAAITDAKVKIGTLSGEINACENEVKRLNSNLVSVSARLELNFKQLEENALLIADINGELDKIRQMSENSDDQRIVSIRSKLNNYDEYKQKLQVSLAGIDSTRMALIDELQQLHERKNREEFQLIKVDTDIEQMQQRVQEEYDLDYGQCLPFKEENYEIEKGITESNRLRRQMSSLGHVNLEAIEMCKEVYESYHEMDVQREDLVKAEDDLLKIIKDLSGQMLGLFTEAFEKIRTSFVRIFKELFDGGTADLLLLESENPLEAGIEIVAQPPEKKLQSISLLSGGERALTAIAILFAILKLKPMPFCVLDEIEAALDDANAGRFAKYLRRFSEETQFIVITHRKPTMELSDSLYGVTMEEKGVSKIVSVKLSEAFAQAEPV